MFRAAVNLLDYFLDLCTGYSIKFGSREERKLAQDYDHSAQLVSLTINLCGEGPGTEVTASKVNESIVSGQNVPLVSRIKRG
jgi:hypothetical protein